MTLLEFASALAEVVPSCYHYEADRQDDQYIVWAEDGQADSVFADGKMVEQTITGTVDYFTRVECDPNFFAIQRALNDTGAAWRLGSIQYEVETGYTHYEWVFELPMGVEG